MARRVPFLNARLQGYTTTIFAEMSALAAATDSVNLGQGFPDIDGPSEISEAAVAAIRAGRNQYPPGRGVPELLDAVSAHQRHWYGLSFDPSAEILITAGATEALAACLLALCEVGDEVIMFEPYYDAYAAITAMAGATRRVVSLRPPHWSFDPDQLRGTLTPRSRLLLLNSPHNPTGRVFSRSELEEIARLCVEHDLLAVTDEVYEHLVFDGEHIPLASMPGMRERTITISSAAKTFSFTGWKVGWASGPQALIDAVRTAKQFLTYVNAAPFQYAIAGALAFDDARFHAISADLASRRDLLCAGLARTGLEVFVPQATYFVTTDIQSVAGEDESAAAFCRSLPERCGVVAIPSSVFYDDPDTARWLVRWTFCKRTEVLEEALGRLKNLG